MWFIGIDPSRRGFHALVLLDEKKKVLHQDRIEGLKATLNFIKAAQTRGQKKGHCLIIGIEAFNNNLCAELHENGFNVFELSASKIRAFQKSLDPSGQKTDEVDASACAMFLAERIGILKPYQSPSELEKKSKVVAKELNYLKEARTTAWQRLWDLTDYSTPELKGCIKNPDTPWFLIMLRDLPGKTKRMGLKAFIAFCRKRRAAIDNEQLELLWTYFKHFDNNCMSHRSIRLRAEVIISLTADIEDWVEQAADLNALWQYGDLLSTIPGMGDKTMIQLLAHIGEDWEDKSAKQVAGYTVAPVLKGTGVPDKKTLAKMTERERKRAEPSRTHRLSANKELKTALCLFSFCSMRRNPWAKQTYDEYKARDQEHWEALRNLSMKWLRIIFAMIKTGEAYDYDRISKNKKIITAAA